MYESSEEKKTRNQSIRKKLHEPIILWLDETRKRIYFD